MWGSDGHLRDHYPRLSWLICSVIVVVVVIFVDRYEIRDDKRRIGRQASTHRSQTRFSTFLFWCRTDDYILIPTCETNWRESLGI